ncbi:MAG: c-type cytochrome [Microthrixaceae bacterium]
MPDTRQHRSGRRRSTARRRVLVTRPLLAAPLLVAPLLVLACGGSGGGDDSAEPALEGPAAEGLQLVREHGCASCHSSDGRRSLGPTWQGLYGSDVTLDGGEVVVADDAYLTRSIEDPGAQIVEGSTGVMPRRDLSADEVAAIVAYLRTLADRP